MLAWDWIVARFIYLEALELDLPMRFSLFVTFSSGPPGLLVHLATKAAVMAWRGSQQSTTEAPPPPQS